MEPDDNPLLAAALRYAGRGWQVIPLHDVVCQAGCTCKDGAACKTPGKHPRVADWTKRGSTSGADLYEWWGTWPRANVGVLTGRASGFWALDVDGDHGGWNTLAGLAQDYGTLPATRIHRTGSGGAHYLWTLAPPDAIGHVVPSTSGREGNALGPGLDTRGEGGMIVMPPSVSGKGAYQVGVECDPATPPDWLVDRMREILARRHATGTGALEVPGLEAVADRDLSRKLRLLLAELKGDGERHQWFWQIIAQARRDGLRPGQAAAAVDPWCRAVGKFVGRVPTEVARVWARLDAETAATTVEVPQPPPAPSGPPPGNGEGGNYAIIVPFPQPVPPAATPPGWTPPQEQPPAWEPPPAPPRTADRVKPIDLRARWDATPEEVEWLWEPIVERGRLCVIYSPPGAGKSILCQEAAAALAAGWDPPGSKATDPVAVAYVDNENCEADVIGRLKDMGHQAEELDLLRYYAFPDLLPLDTELGGREFVQLIADIGVQIAFLDTTGKFLAGDENDAGTHNSFYDFTLRPLKALGISVVLLDHSGKDLDKKQRGSSAKAGDPDVTWRMTTSTNGRIQLKREKDRLGRGPCTLSIRRLTGPLRHDVTVAGPRTFEGPDGEVRLDGALDAVALDVIRHLDELGAPIDISSRAATTLLRSTRMPEGVRRVVLLTALRFRQAMATGYPQAVENEADDDQ